MEFKQQGKKFSFHTFWLKNGGGWVWWKLFMVVFSVQTVDGVLLPDYWKYDSLCWIKSSDFVSVCGEAQMKGSWVTQKYMYLYLFGDWRFGQGGFLISLMGIELIDRYMIELKLMHFLFVLRLINGLFSTTFIPFVKIPVMCKNSTTRYMIVTVMLTRKYMQLVIKEFALL